MADSPYTPLLPLDGSHQRDAFDCGSPALNLYLRQYALQNQKRGIVRNYVTMRTGSAAIAAFYSLVYSSIDQKLLPPKVVKGLGRFDVPAMLLARLAVDRREQGQGLGKALLKDAILRTMRAAEIAGLKLLLVHAKDDVAAAFYQKHGFVALPDDPLKLFLPISLHA
jgi:GNAT superfamily N-acetyltransferase